VLRGLKRYAMIALVISIVLTASIPQSTAEFEFRKEIRAGDLLFNSETTIMPLIRSLFHQETVATTDTEAFAMSPLSSTAGEGLTIAQTSADTAVATRTGVFVALLPFLRIDEYPGTTIGDGLNWVAKAEPITFAGLPKNTMMVFPGMDLIKRMDNAPGEDFSYVIDTTNSCPFLPGNVLDVKTVPNGRGGNETVFERKPKDYMTLIATPEQVANKTIMERMWRNVHLNYNLDRAYVGETCYPSLIDPLKNPFELTPMVPDNRSISDSLNMTQPGKHLLRVFWPVGV
jgi:hypothetical protein